jgi:hypothetical protein
VRRFAVGLLALSAIGYLSAATYVKLNETALIFPREVAAHGLPAPADSLHLPYRTTTFRTADSVVLSTWIIPAAHDDSTGMWVLLCHGQTGNLATTTRPEYYADLRMIGVNILAFDWRGFGASEGSPSEAGLYRDATAAYEYLRTVEHVPADQIIIFGHSLGTAPAIELATRVPAAGLVVEGAPASVRQRGQELYPWLPLSLISSIEFNSLGRIGQVKMPKLFFHAVADTRIPIAHGRALFAAATEPKRFVETLGDHPNVFRADSAKYFGEYRRFVLELAALHQ